MDDYIKRKIKTNEDDLKNQHGVNVQSEIQIITRQSRQQIRELLLKINIIQQRSCQIKNKLMEIQLKTNEFDIKNNSVLDRSSLQKSSREDTLFDRQTSNSGANVQQTKKLGSVERVALKRDAKQTKRPIADVDSQKLQQPSKGIGKTRKIRKAI